MTARAGATRSHDPGRRPETGAGHDARAGAGVARLLIGCLLAVACARSPEHLPDQTGEVYLFPPSNPRIRYLRSIRTPADAGIRPGVARKLLTFLTGASRPRLVRPGDVAADGELVAVADAGAGVVHVFDRGRRYRSLHRLEAWELQAPTGVAVAGDRLYVTDSTARLALRISVSGRLLGHLGAPRELVRPTGIAVDEERGRVYVVDTGAHVVVVYDLDGRRIRVLGGRGVDTGRFNFPTHVAVGPTGEVAVADALNFRVQVFTPDLRFHHAVGAAGDGPGCFSRPKGVAFNSDGHLYVADALFDNIQIFDRRGRLLLAFGSTGARAGQFRMPAGLNIDERDRIMVAEFLGGRVSVFDYLGEAGLHGALDRDGPAALQAGVAR